MGTISPDITKQTGEVTREQTAGNTRLSDLLAAALGTADDQFGQTTAQNSDILKQVSDLITGQSKQTADYNAAKLAQDKQIADRTLAQQTDAEKFQEDQAKRAQAVADQNSAQARADAVAKTQRIHDATDAVNKSFAGYDDGYFNKYAQDYTNAQQPSLDQKYDDVQHDTALDFANKGTLEGSAAVRQFGKVAAQKASEAAQIAQQGSNAAEALRARVDQQRQSQLQASISEALLTPNVPIAGIANPDAAVPTSKAANSATAASTAPSFGVTQGGTPASKTPDPTPVAGATVDETKGVPAPKPEAPPPADDGMMTISLPDGGSFQIPRFAGIPAQAPAAATPAPAPAATPAPRFTQVNTNPAQQVEKTQIAPAPADAGYNDRAGPAGMDQAGAAAAQQAAEQAAAGGPQAKTEASAPAVKVI